MIPFKSCVDYSELIPNMNIRRLMVLSLGLPYPEWSSIFRARDIFDDSNLLAGPMMPSGKTPYSIFVERDLIQELQLTTGISCWSIAASPQCHLWYQTIISNNLLPTQKRVTESFLIEFIWRKILTITECTRNTFLSIANVWYHTDHLW